MVAVPRIRAGFKTSPNRFSSFKIRTIHTSAGIEGVTPHSTATARMSSIAGRYSGLHERNRGLSPWRQGNWGRENFEVGYPSRVFTWIDTSTHLGLNASGCDQSCIPYMDRTVGERRAFGVAVSERGAALSSGAGSKSRMLMFAMRVFLHWTAHWLCLVGAISAQDNLAPFAVLHMVPARTGSPEQTIFTSTLKQCDFTVNATTCIRGTAWRCGVERLAFNTVYIRRLY